MRVKRLRLARAVGGFALLAVVGCGSGRGDLGGAVSYQGKPLRYGSVSVVGGDGMPKTVMIRDDGRYEVADLPAGPVKLAVTSPDPAKSQPKARKKDDPPPKVSNAGWFPVPDKYADFSTSSLTITVAAGSNAFDIDLK